jgi:hypothetical protein
VPADFGAGVAGSQGIAFLVSAGIVAEIVAKACSSPQTTEINIDQRGPTLMKWVHIGLVEGALFVLIAATIDRRHRGAIIAGGLTEGVITYVEYLHGKAAGMASDQPGTETYGQ